MTNENIFKKCRRREKGRQEEKKLEEEKISIERKKQRGGKEKITLEYKKDDDKEWQTWIFFIKKCSVSQVSHFVIRTVNILIIYQIENLQWNDINIFKKIILLPFNLNIDFLFHSFYIVV